MRPFKVKILASDHPFYEGECYSLTLPTTNGMYGIFARHSNMIAAIVPGTMHYRLREDEQHRLRGVVHEGRGVLAHREDQLGVGVVREGPDLLAASERAALDQLVPGVHVLCSPSFPRPPRASAAASGRRDATVPATHDPRTPLPERSLPS